jgi:hypothetical protein
VIPLPTLLPNPSCPPPPSALLCSLDKASPNWLTTYHLCLRSIATLSFLAATVFSFFAYSDLYHVPSWVFLMVYYSGVAVAVEPALLWPLPTGSVKGR